MLSIMMLIGVGIWFWWSFRGKDQRDNRREETEFTEKIADRQAIVERMPESSSAWESLGDAFRQAERSEEAVTAYERAIELAEVNINQSGGWIGGAGLEGKLKLAKMEADPNGELSYVNTKHARQQICRQCGNLSAAGARECENCGDVLPLDTIMDAWKDEEVRKPIVRDAIQLATMLLVVTIALAIFNGMPIEIKGVLFISTIIVAGWKLLRIIGGK